MIEMNEIKKNSMDDYGQLVKLAQQGNREERRAAFDQLTLNFQGMALQQAFNVLRDSHMAEDAAQEAFLTAYLRIDQLKEPEAFPGWLRRIVLTHCDRMIRGIQPEFEPLEVRYDLAAEKPSPETLVEELELQSRIKAALNTLPEHERAVTERFYMQGESQKEIAEGLQLPITTVKKRLQYAREHLRLLFEDLNATIDQAIADILHPQEPQRQPIYIYTPHDEQN